MMGADGVDKLAGGVLRADLRLGATEVSARSGTALCLLSESLNGKTSSTKVTSIDTEVSKL
jgi:hypothetical protein